LCILIRHRNYKKYIGKEIINAPVRKNLKKFQYLGTKVVYFKILLESLTTLKSLAKRVAKEQKPQ
jgi:hypothetical protein